MRERERERGGGGRAGSPVMLKPVGPVLLRTGWGLERLHGGLVLRACLLLTAFSVCAHVYLERVRGGQASPAPLAAGAAHPGRPTTAASRPRDGRGPGAGAGTARPGRALGRGAASSYVRDGATEAKDPSLLSREMEEGGEGRPPLRPQKKVNRLLLMLIGGC